MPTSTTDTSQRFMVSAGHEEAAQAAYDVLEAGGNAVDAGVAAILVLGVVLSEQVNIAGVAPMVVYLADRDETVTIDGVGYWPKGLDTDAYIERHAGQIALGVERSVVPASPDACLQALERFGTMGYADVVGHAIRCAKDGFPVHATMVRYLTDYESELRHFPENMAIWMPEGRIPEVGDHLVLPDLARTLEYLRDEDRAAASAGREAGLAAVRRAFYAGDLAETIVRFYEAEGGCLTREDLATFSCRTEPAVSRTFDLGGQPVEITTCGPWCQGPMLLQTLAILESTGLASMTFGGTEYLHTVAEALKLAFADREAYLGDPAFVPVPVETLIDSGYGRERARQIDPGRAAPGMPYPGEIAGHRPYLAPEVVSPAPERVSADTSIVTVIDGDGNAFCANPSDPSWDVPVVPGTGLVVSSRGSQSWAVPGHPSVLAPGKRPRLTPNPGLARVRGEWLMPFGSPGGDSQVPGNLQFLLAHTLAGMDLQAAVEAPRIMTHSHPNSFAPHASQPGVVDVEAPIPASVSDALAERGHEVRAQPQFSFATAGVCAVKKDLRTGELSAAADPRRPSRAMGG